jgi:K+-sensing histidine kinase KdpD
MKNARSWSPFSRIAAFGAATLVTAVAFGVRYLIHPWVEPYAPFQAFVLACVVSEFYFGLGPALLSLVMGGLLGTYYFVRPYQTFASMITRSDIIVTGNFVLVSVFVIVLIEVLRRTLYAKQLLLKVSQSRHRISLYRENDRLFLSRKSADTAALVEQLLSRFDRTLLLQLDDERYYPQALLYQLAPSLGSRALKRAHWLEAFHPEDRASLDAAFAEVRSDSGTRPVISARIGEAADASVLVLERLEFEGMLATVLRLEEATPAAQLEPGVAPEAPMPATESRPRKPYPFRPGRIPK